MLLLLSVVLLAPPQVDYPALQQRVQRGNYAEARAGYEAILAEPSPPVVAFVGQAHCLRAEGDYTAALAALDAGLKRHPADPNLLAQRADLLYFLGQWDAAAADAEAALQKHDGNFLARWTRARILRDKGDLAAADTEVRWFVRTYTAANAAGKDLTDPEVLLLVGLAGAENARWNNKPQQFQFILQEICADALQANPDFWQAENLAGRLLLEKHNRADAADAFDKALKINPRAVEALVGKGQLALAEQDPATASRLADQALKVNPKHPEALRLKADVRLAEGDLAAAERLLRAARLINPREEPTLARLAAILHLQRQPIDAIVQDVQSFCRKPGVFYLELAQVLVARKQYAPAEDYFQKALAHRPDLAAARAGLGLLLLQLGREPEAQVQLEAAAKADPFHVRVANALRVLKHLSGYATRETPHFVIKYDARTDRVLAAWLADYLEQLQAEYARQYGFTPPGKVLVEIMATREMFSGRVLTLRGLPGAAQGASTGPLIVLPSPHADGTDRPYNWAAVTRHELTHVFNLMQTEYLVPIWLTEGLAVRAERSNRFDTNRDLLRDRLADGTAFTLETIARGYHNFANPAEVMLAYHQGWLYVEYIHTQHGPDGIARLLAAYRAGRDTETALRQALGLSLSEFEQGYRKFVRELVGVAPPRDKPMTLAELETAHKAQPDNPDIAARLAEEYVRRSKPAEARKLAEAVLARQPGHPGAAIVLARLLQRDKDPAGARAVLEQAAQRHPDNPRVLTALARLLTQANDRDPAIATWEALRKLGSPDLEVLEALDKLYAATQQPDRHAEVLTALAARQPDNLTVRLQLAKLYQAQGLPAKVEYWAREALFVDVGHPEARELLLTALRAQKNDARADTIDGWYKPQ